MKANYVTRGGTTAKAAKAASRAARYYTFRDGPDQASRIWHTSDGRTASYDAIKGQIRADAKAYGYTYRVVLSTKDADITAEGYRQVLADRFERWYFIEHHNTDFPHAHVIGFRKQLVKKAELQAMREQVAALEQARAQEQAAQRDQAHEHDGPAPRREREQDYGLG